MHLIHTLSARLWVSATTAGTRKPAKWEPALAFVLQFLFILALWMLLSDAAFAGDSSSSSSSGSDPWTSSLGKLQATLNGTVAKSIGTIALFAAGGMLVFGGELNEFTKKILMVVLAVGVMILGNSLITNLFA